MDFTKLGLNTPLQIINQAMRESLIGNLGIEITLIDEGVVKSTMVVSNKNCRPDGKLHGGASLAMAETLAGLGSMLLVDLMKFEVLGIQVSGSHTGMLKGERAFAEAKIIHKGNQTHIWSVDITDRNNRLISTARVTNMILKKNE